MKQPNNEDGIRIHDLLSDSEWDAVGKRLAKVFRRLRIPKSEIENAIQSLLVAFFAHPTNFGFDQTRFTEDVTALEAVAIFLVGVAKNKGRDYLRRLARDWSRYTPFEIEGGRGLDDDRPFEILARAPERDSPDYGIKAMESRQELLDLFCGDEIASAVINAVPLTTGGGHVNQELAEIVFGDSAGKDAAAIHKIVAAKKRIQRLWI